MVWTIATVSVPSGQSVILFGNSTSGQVIANPGYVMGGNFVLAFPGLGYIQLIDKGNSVPGPGDWSVQLSNGNTNWFYRGQGEGHVTVNANGSYTFSGPNGTNTVSGTLVKWA